MSEKCCLNILVLEDEIDICDLIEYSVTDLNLNVFKALSQNEAVQHLKQNEIEFGFFDYHLENGQEPLGANSELLALIKEKEDFEFVIITGDYNIDEESQNRIGAAKVFHKPLSCEELQNIVRDFLLRKRDKLCKFKNRTCPVVI